jgi:ketosteroid isomerase-like protein
MTVAASQIVQDYFAALERKQGWESFLAEDFSFTSYASPNRRLAGRDAYLAATRRFFSMISSLELKKLIVDGETVCAQTRYELRSPSGGTFQSDVAEVFGLRDGKIASLGIYFDSAPYPK